MTFQPIVPFSGVAGLQYVERTQEHQKEIFVSSPVNKREIQYFKDHISKVSNAEELVKDYTLLKVALGAFGLQDDINKKYFIKKVLEEGTEDPDAFANKLVDPRYRKISDAFGFGNTLGSQNQNSEFIQNIVEEFTTEQFEVAVGNSNNSVRLAMYFKRQISEIASNQATDTAWYQIMGNTPLRTVFETAFGLPKSIGALEVERQLEIFKEKSEVFLGTDSPSIFANEDRIAEFVNTFLSRDQLNTGPTNSTAGFSALSLLTSSNFNTNLLLSNSKL